MADTVPTSGTMHVTRADSNLSDPKFNETFYVLVTESELYSKVVRVDICCQPSSSNERQSLVSITELFISRGIHRTVRND